MDDKEKFETQEQSTEEQSDTNNKITEKPKVIPEDDAGPSGVILPGAIPQSPFNKIKPGVSKSEHNIRQIITSKDVANALKLTSLSFGNANKTNVDVKELKIPILDENKEDESITLVELKKFMTSCFKLNKNISNVVNETTNVNVHSAISTITNDLVQNIPNISLATNKRPLNEVVVTNTDSKQPKNVENNKKKNSGSLSEKSDLGVTQRDSLSSIGSNVCRICMTRGRERYIIFLSLLPIFVIILFS